MDRNDRAMIDRCCDYLASQINMLRLWPKLLEHKVFNPDDVNASRWEKNLSAEETTRDVLLTIKTRGPEAFAKLAQSLREIKQYALADVLQGYRSFDDMHNESDDEQLLQSDGNDVDDGSGNDASVNDDHHKNLHKKVMPLVIKVRKAKKFLDTPDYRSVGRYPMRSNPRGYVLLITIQMSLVGEPRKAVERDEACLVKLFKEMGFEIEPMRNLTGEGILEAVKKFSQRNFTRVDSCFVIISAHGHATVNDKGDNDTEIAGTDYDLSGSKKVLCSNIIDCFTVQNCPSLAEKPKIFIFQACRGEKRHEIPQTVTDGIRTTSTQRNYSDILIAHSTMHGYVSYRNNVSGSWYIQILCEVFMNYAYKLHLQELLQKVDKRLAGVRDETDIAVQTSTIKLVGFNKQCYLNPGLFLNSNS